MDVVRINHKHIPLELRSSVGCIGYFDGFHKGHQGLVKKAIEISKEKGIDSSIITFDPDPWSVFKPDYELKHLMTLSDKIQFSKSCGVDHFYILTFTLDFASLSTDEFHAVLKNMNIDTLVCGFDFQYGTKNSGSVDTLKVQSDFDVVVVESINEEDEKISSSRIEPLIEKGELKKANELSGFIYSVEGDVVHGFKRGSSLLQIPTANLEVERDYILPSNGVYAGAVSIDSDMYLAMINIGNNPTFENEVKTIEAHILDFDQNIYDKKVRFYFYSKIRDEQKFDNFHHLKAQLLSDIETTRQIMMNKTDILTITAETWDKNLLV